MMYQGRKIVDRPPAHLLLLARSPTSLPTLIGLAMRSIYGTHSSERPFQRTRAHKDAFQIKTFDFLRIPMFMNNLRRSV